MYNAAFVHKKIYLPAVKNYQFLNRTFPRIAKNLYREEKQEKKNGNMIFNNVHAHYVS